MRQFIWIIKELTKQRRREGFPRTENVSLALHIPNETKATNCVTGDLVGRLTQWVIFKVPFVLMHQ